MKTPRTAFLGVFVSSSILSKKVNGFSLFLPGSFAVPRTDPQPVDMDDAVVEFNLGAVVALEPVDI